MCHFAPKRRFATSHHRRVGRVRSERQSRRLPRITESVERVTDDGAVERLAHHRERDGGVAGIGHRSGSSRGIIYVTILGALAYGLDGYRPNILASIKRKT